MTEQELLQAHGMSRHEFRQYEGGEGCSCGKEWGHNGSLPGVGMAPTEERKHAGLIPDGAGMRSAPAMLASPDSSKHTPQNPEPGCEFCEAGQ